MDGRFTTGKLLSFAKGLRSSPRHAAQMILAVIRGTAYAFYFRIARRSVIIRLPFLAYERVSINGPGRVEIGPHCAVYANVFQGLNIVTLSAAARVTIGRACSLGGLTIRAARQVAIGDRTMTAYSLVQDALMCDSASMKSANASGRLVEPVNIGRNVWLASSSCILAGTSIGDDSVISQGACTLGVKVGGFALATGNLHTRSLSIEQLLKLKGCA